MTSVLLALLVCIGCYSIYMYMARSVAPLIQWLTIKSTRNPLKQLKLIVCVLLLTYVEIYFYVYRSQQHPPAMLSVEIS